MVLPALTVVYLTFRVNPRFEWFVASLNRELRSMPDFDRNKLQVLVIDGLHPRRLEADFPIEHHPPKPTVWQGRHRLTNRDYFAAASSRNTAFALARHEHVAFVDDLSVLLPGWLKAHVHAAAHGYVLCGTTCKQKNIEVSPDGQIVRYDEHAPGRDSRLGLFPDGMTIFRCPGGWLYGGTFSVPLEHALRVNGQDEIHDTIGGEDYDFGERLERWGSSVYISRSCGTLEDEDGHHVGEPMVRLDKPWPPTSLRAPRTLTPGQWTDSAQPTEAEGPYSSNYLFNRLRRDAGRSWTLGNDFDLRELRDRVLAGGSFPIPTEPSVHWVDGQPLAEM